MNRLKNLSFVLLAIGLLAGCAGKRAFQRAQEYSQAQEWDQAVIFYQKALLEEPTNIEFRKALEIARVKASQYHLELAKAWNQAGVLERAEAEYRIALELDPTNQFAADSLANLLQRIQEAAAASRAATSGKSDLELLKEETRGTTGVPLLRPDSDKPITINFPPNTKVKDIYVALGKASGINVLFDSGIQDRETFSIDIAGVPFQKALDQIALANRHFYRVVDEKTLFLSPDTPQKRRDYEDQVIKTYYLSNANPSDMVNVLRGLLDTRRIVPNQALNAITIRDTPGKLAVIERIVEANDKPPAEVVIDVEIHEVNRSSSLNIGSNLSTFTVTQALDQTDTVSGAAGDVRGLRLSNIPHVNQADWLLTIPDLFYTLRKSKGTIRTLARPSLRVADGKQVTLRLGDQVPIETSTFVGAGGTGTNVARNFQFRDIGTNIDITPRVHHNNELTLMLQVEVTSAGTDPDGPEGPVPPTFGNRRINTEIRLKDGETNLLAGLFTSSETSSLSGLPGVIDVPVLKSVFGSNSRERRETEIILTITPHIVRTPNIQRRDLEAYYVGTETNVGDFPASSFAPPGRSSPFDAREGADSGDGTSIIPEPSTGGDVPEPGPPTDLPSAPSFVPDVPPQPDPDAGGSAGDPSGGTAGDPSGGTAGDPSGSTRNPVTAPPVVEAVARVYWQPASVTVTAGQEFSMDVAIENAIGVGHTPFWVTFNKDVVDVIGVDQGSFLGADGNPVQFLHNVLTSGRLIVGLSRLGSSVTGVDGSGTLVTVRMRAKAPGSSPLGFVNNHVRNASNRPIKAVFDPGSVTVEP